MEDTQSNVLVLADGTKIDKTSGSVVKDEQEQPELLDENEEEEEEEVTSIKGKIPVNRYLTDLPGDLNSTRAVAVICGLTLFGMGDRDIAYICKTDIEKVTSIKQSQRYEDFSSGVVDNVMRAQGDNVRSMFVNNAKSAAEHIISGLKSKNPEVRHMASKEVLDRGGFRPVDVVEHRIRHENELKIVHIKGDVERSVVIEADYDG